jgi:hypothetical protein
MDEATRMTSLNEALATMRAEKEAARDPAATAIMNRSTEELRASGIMDRVLGVGDPAPMFARPNVRGETIRLRSVLKDGPAVVSFFRGRW